MGEFDHRLACAGPQRAAATEDRRPLCRGQELDGLGHDLGSGYVRPKLRWYIAEARRAGWPCARPSAGRRDSQHHRPPLVLGNVEGLAHVVHHARHAMRGDVVAPVAVTSGAWSIC